MDYKRLRFKKKSQVSLILLLGIFILLVVVLLMNLRGTSLKEINVKSKPNLVGSQDLVKSYFTNCLKESANRGLLILSFRGGFIESNEGLSFIEVDEDFKVPLLYNEGNFEIITREDVKKDLEFFIENDVYTCLKDIKPKLSTEYGLDVNEESENPVINVEIEDNYIIVKMYSKVNVVSKKGNFSINEFETKINVKLGRIIDQINSIIDKMLVNDFYSKKKDITDNIGPYLSIYPDISLSFITEGMDLYTEYWIYDSNTIIWMIYNTANQEEIDNNTYRLIFATRGIKKINPKFYQEIIPQQNPNP